MVKFNFLDFISTSPNFFIFQNEANKTNFGGVLFLIYIIIMFFISLGYILDYHINPKYVIETSVYRYSPEDKIVPPPDPVIDLEIIVVLREDSNITDTLYIYEVLSGKIYNGSYSTELDLYNNEVGIITYLIKGIKLDSEFRLYSKLNNSNITDEEEYYLELPNIDYVIVTTHSVQVDNYATNPLIISDDFDYSYSYEYLYEVENDRTFSSRIHWTSLSYKEKLGISSLFYNLFNISKTYIYGNIDNYLSFTSTIPLRIPYCGDNEERRCIFIGDIIFYQSYFLEYSRKKIEITDVLATIGALASTLNFVFSLIYKFYSKNFDNYKIIQNILQPNNINNINRKFKPLELNNMININSPLIDEKQEKEIEAKIDKKNNINNDDNLEKYD